MAKARQSTENAKALVSPLFAWSNAVLKGGEMMLDSMAAAAKNVKDIRVAVLPDGDTPQRRPASRKAKRKARRRR
jgi:hypothetical protein